MNMGCILLILGGYEHDLQVLVKTITKYYMNFWLECLDAGAMMFQIKM